MLVLMGLGFDPASSARSAYGPKGELFGELLQISAQGEITVAGDVSVYEKDVNPAGGPVDSNPFGLLVLPTFRLVADAGGNALLSVLPSGLVNTVAVFPSRPIRTTDSVPTAVAVGPARGSVARGGTRSTRVARDQRRVDRHRDRCYRRRSGSMSRIEHGLGIGALMFPVYLVPVTIMAVFAAVVGLYCRDTARD